MLFNVKVLIYLDILLLIGLTVFRWALVPSARAMIGPKVMALVLGTPVVGLLSGNGYVFHAYLACSVAFTSRTRDELCCTYLLMLPMVPGLQLDLIAGGTYLMVLASAGSMNIGALVGMALTRGSVRRTDPSLDILMLLLFCVYVSIEVRGVTSTAILRVVVQSAVALIPPYLLASRSAVDVEAVRRLLTYLCLAAFLGAVVAVFEAVRRWDLYEPFYGALRIPLKVTSSALSIRGGFLRVGGPIGDYSSFGLFLAVAIAILPALRRPFSRAGFVCLSAGLLAGILATQSRGAWVGLLVGFVAFQWLRDRRGSAIAVFGAAAGAYLALRYLLSPTSSLSETFGTSGASTETIDYRRQLLEMGLQQVAAHPLLGQPPKQLETKLEALRQGQHIVDFVNTHLFIAMVTGLLGFAVWFVVWSSTVLRVVSRRRLAAPDLRRSGLSIVPAVMIVTACVALAFTSIVDRNLYWLLLAAGFATPMLVRAPGARRGSPGALAGRSDLPGSLTTVRPEPAA